jgi:hypothetical protein
MFQFLDFSKITSKSLGWLVYFRPLWFVSLGLHVLLLAIPLPDRAVSPKSTKSVKITKLAVNPEPKPELKSELPKKPKFAAKSKPILPKSARRPIQKSRKQGSPVASRPSPTSTATPTPTPTPTSTPAPKGEPQKTADGSVEKAWKNFPRYPDAATGCEEYCSQTPASLQDVATYFERELAVQRWDFEGIPTQEATRKVYRVKRGGSTKFLSILTAQPSGTVYVLAEQERNLEDLDQIRESIGMIGSILDEMKAMPVDSSSTAKPQRFERAADIVSMNLVEGIKPDAIWKTYFDSAFKKDAFEVAPSTDYGGDPVYAVKRASFMGYLSLSPSVDGNGTVIVLWKVSPS